MADGTHTLFVNGTILTVDPQSSMAEAMVIADRTILAIGTEAEVRAAASPEATVIDLQGKTLMPGLIDAHMHPMGGGAQLTACSLNPATSPWIRRWPRSRFALPRWQTNPPTHGCRRRAGTGRRCSPQGPIFPP
jgi:cytosine/adenosine deaminase-related metal-dependent hydrolase